MVPCSTPLGTLQERVIACERCPRLRAWCAQVAQERRRAYAGETYWGRPVPSFGDPAARLVLVGLAPGAHGANRTGRMFTGDRSGDFLFAALHRAGLASRPDSRRRDDGMRLRDAYITAAVRCAPPSNRPAAEEMSNCRPYLERELELLRRARVFIALGGLAFGQLWPALREAAAGRKFAHGAAYALADGRRLLAAYHPSQQNTFTGRLTAAMFDAVLSQALRLAEASG